MDYVYATVITDVASTKGLSEFLAGHGHDVVGNVMPPFEVTLNPSANKQNQPRVNTHTGSASF